MDAERIEMSGDAIVAEARALGDAVARLRRIGLVVEPATLSRENRRLAYAFVRREATRLGAAEATRARATAPAPRIGFPYPNAR